MKFFFLCCVLVSTYSLGTYCRPEEVGAKCPIVWPWFNPTPVCGKHRNIETYQLVFNSPCHACSNSSIKVYYKGRCWNDYKYCQSRMMCNSQSKKVCGVKGTGLPKTYNSQCQACNDNVIGYIENECKNLQNRCDQINPNEEIYYNTSNCIFYPNKPFTSTRRLGCSQLDSVIILGQCPDPFTIDYSTAVRPGRYTYCRQLLTQPNGNNYKDMCGLFRDGLPADIGNPVEWCNIGELTAYIRGSCDSFLIACPAKRKVCQPSPSSVEWCGFGEQMKPRRISDREVCCQGTNYTHFIMDKCP